VKPSRVLILSFLITLSACKKTDPPVVFIADDDPQMKEAIQKARTSTDAFIAALKTPRPNQTSFAIKVRFVDGNDAEFMWLSPVTFDGKKFSGTLNNNPEKLKNVKMGHKASVEPAEIADWMYVQDGKLVGGYTVRVARDKMPPEERAKWDRTVPFRLD